MRKKRVDANQAGLVELLRWYGLSVETELFRVGRGVPDLLVGGELPCPHCGRSFRQNLLLEVKTPLGKLDEAQRKWHASWRGQVEVVTNQADCERLIGLAVKRQTGEKS